MAPSGLLAPAALSATAARLFSALSLVAILVYIFKESAGVGFTSIPGKGEKLLWDPVKAFNWHPLFMVIGYPILMGEALLVWRHGLWYGSRSSRKTWHIIFHSLAIVALLLALIAVICEKNMAVPQRAHMATVHGWLGVAILLLSGLQFFTGLVAFWVLRNKSWGSKAGLLDYHRFLGFATFLAGTAECALGATELSFTSTNPGAINALGLLGLAMGAVALFVMLALHGPQPAPRPEEMGKGAHGDPHQGGGIEANGYSKYGGGTPNERAHMAASGKTPLPGV